MATKRLLLVPLLAAVVSNAQASEPMAGTGPIPAPPGPYRSSMPYLYDGDSAKQTLPYHGALRYPFAEHNRPYFGPGRYWGQEESSARDPQRLSTMPVPPWGPQRPAVEKQDQAADPGAATGASGQVLWGPWQRPSPYGQPWAPNNVLPDDPAGGSAKR